MDSHLPYWTFASLIWSLQWCHSRDLLDWTWMESSHDNGFYFTMPNVIDFGKAWFKFCSISQISFGKYINTINFNNIHHHKNTETQRSSVQPAKIKAQFNWEIMTKIYNYGNIVECTSQSNNNHNTVYLNCVSFIISIN